VGEWVDYRENMALASTATGVIAQPADFAWHLDLVDTGNCRVLVQGVILEPKPYVVATRLAWSFNGLGQIGSIVTQPGDPLFDAQTTLDWASKESWGTIPPEQRDTRDELLSAANAYLDRIGGDSVAVPIATPCARLQGGSYSEDCDPGAAGSKVVAREVIVDETKGAVAVLLRSGGPDGPPGAYIFRIEDGGIRYVHTLTPCGEQENCR
jgi:hypothetical protein